LVRFQYRLELGVGVRGFKKGAYSHVRRVGLTVRRCLADAEGRGPFRSGPSCFLLPDTPFEWGMMEVSIRGPVWRGPCSHPMSPKCSFEVRSSPFLTIQVKSRGRDRQNCQGYRFVSRRRGGKRSKVSESYAEYLAMESVATSPNSSLRDDASFNDRKLMVDANRRFRGFTS